MAHDVYSSPDGSGSDLVLLATPLRYVPDCRLTVRIWIGQRDRKRVNPQRHLRQRDVYRISPLRDDRLSIVPSSLLCTSRSHHLSPTLYPTSRVTSMTVDPDNMSEAGPSTLTPGPTPYHETSQFRHWRYSPSQLNSIRAELNTRSVEVFKRNSQLEKVRPELSRISRLLTGRWKGYMADGRRKRRKKWGMIFKLHLLRHTYLSTTSSCF